MMESVKIGGKNDGMNSDIFISDMFPETVYKNKTLNGRLIGSPGNRRLETPEFVIEHDYLTFMFECGAWDNEVGIRFLVDGEIQFELSEPVYGLPVLSYAFDLREFAGKRGKISIGGGGTFEFITVENLYLTNTMPPDTVLIRPYRDLVKLDYGIAVKDGKYLNLPVDRNRIAKYLNIMIDGKIIRNICIQLADNGRCDFIASIPVEEYAGKTIRIFTDTPVMTPSAYEFFTSRISTSETPSRCEVLYREKGRPKLHFTPPFGGNIDMIGFYCYNREYHIGYLLDPVFNKCHVNNSWAGSVSRDLFSWRGQRMLIRKGYNCKMTSGSAVVDTGNRSGLQEETDKPPILLYYSRETHTAQRWQIMNPAFKTPFCDEMLSAVSIKYSTDGGTVFKDYENNPVFLSHAVGGHDPEVFYYQPDDKFILVLHDLRGEKWGFDFYESVNLTDWKYISTVEGLWETPNMYPLYPDGGSDEPFWILQQCDMKYLIGTFDGKQFSPKTGLLRVFDGAYAMRTFANQPDGRRIMMAAVLFSYDPEYEFAGFGGATLPLEVTLRNTENGLRMFLNPVAEISDLISSEKHYKNAAFSQINNDNIPSGITDAEISWDTDGVEDFKMLIGGVTVLSYFKASNSCNIGDKKVSFERKRCVLRLIADECVASYFIDGGLYAGITHFSHQLIDPHGCIRIEGEGNFSSACFRGLRSPYNDLATRPSE